MYISNPVIIIKYGSVKHISWSITEHGDFSAMDIRFYQGRTRVLFPLLCWNIMKYPHYSCLITGYFIAFWCFHLISVCFNAHTFHGNSGNSPWNHCKKKRFSPAPVHRWLTSAGRLPVPRPPRPRVGGQDSMATNHCGCETAAVVCCFLLWLLLLLLCFFLWTWRNNA